MLKVMGQRRPGVNALTRDTVTVASRTMVPAYSGLCALWGLVFVIDPQDRLAHAPSLELARQWLALPVWGGLWLTLAAVMTLAALLHDRQHYLAALGICCTSWIAWGGVIEASVFVRPDVSYLAGTLPWFVAVACWASIRSLLAQED
jgi:hypothetical protein